MVEIKNQLKTSTNSPTKNNYMKQKTSSAVFFHVYLFFHFFVILTSKMAIAQRTPVLVRVGVVLDMNTSVGRMGLECINMALSDFYAHHDSHKTRLVLSTRDSSGDVLSAAAATVDLLKNVQVQAIIGPMYSTQANIMVALGDKAQVPIITFTATSPSLASIRSQYFVRATLNDSSQVLAIGAIVQAFGWREVVLIYEDDVFGEGIVPYLVDALVKVNARVPYRSVLPALATDDQIKEELYKLKTMQTRVFIVHMLPPLGPRLFVKAKELQLLSEDYVWIITDGMANLLNSMDISTIESMQGVIGVKPYVQRELKGLEIRYKKKIQQNYPNVLSPDLNIFGLWAYNSAIALAMAAEDAITGDPTFRSVNNSSNSTDLEAIGVSNVGSDLIGSLLNTTFNGSSGDFKLVNGQLLSPPYEIVNVVGRGDRAIGYWTKENGITKNMTTSNVSAYTALKSNFGSTIWPGDKTSPAKGWVIPTNEKKLRIGVPVKDGFTEFVNVTWSSDNTTTVEGYCIDVFYEVVKRLPYGLPFEYIPFATFDRQMAGNYDDLVQQVYLGKYDAVVGDVTIIANRSQYVDFTQPYKESDITMVVPYKNDKRTSIWVFVKPLTAELWMTSFCSFVFIGCLIWTLEHRINEDFRGPPGHQVGAILWFAFSTMVFAQKERIISNLSRFVLIIWFLVVLILTQSYTASLTSMLTVQRLQPTVTDVSVLIKNKEPIGYKNGSYVYGFLQRMNIDDSRLVPFHTLDEMDDLFTKGSGNGGIAAAFHEIPYLEIFLSKYCSKYTLVGPTYKAGGLGFVFPMGSPLVADVSRAILTVTQDKAMVEMERKWLGDQTDCRPDLNLPLQEQNLGFRNFLGLFLILGIAGGIALLINTVMFLHGNRHAMESTDPKYSVWGKMVQLLHRFDNRDLQSRTFKDVHLRNRDHVCSCYAHEYATNQQSPFSLASPGPSPSIPSPLGEGIILGGDQRSSRGYAVTFSQTETSQTVTQEIQLAIPKEDDFSNQPLAHTV